MSGLQNTRNNWSDWLPEHREKARHRYNQRKGQIIRRERRRGLKSIDILEILLKMRSEYTEEQIIDFELSPTK